MRKLSLFNILVIITICNRWADGCQTSMTSEGILTSPGYPSPYPMTKCITIITAPTGQKVSLTLLTMDTYQFGSTCKKTSDRIIVHDKNGGYVKARTWCGDTMPSDVSFTSTANIAKVMLKPHKVSGSYVNTHTGFRISVNFVGGTGTTTTTTSPSTTSGMTTTTGPITCGQSKYSDAGEMDLPEAKIIGGINARPYEFPYMVTIYKKSSGDLLCGGTIWDERTILTAAHCLKPYNLGELEVGVHVHNKNTRAGATIYDPIDQKYHTGFTYATFENDVGLIRLGEDIVFSDEVQPACPPESNNLYQNEIAVISGWGTIDVSTGALSTLPKFATMNTTTNVECNIMMAAGINNPLIVMDSMMCATDNENNINRDTCQGDSGGPMAVKEDDGRFHVVGITSWGYGCASGTPGVYTRVTSFLTWIDNTIATF